MAPKVPDFKLPAMQPTGINVDLKIAAQNLQVGESAPGALQSLVSNLSTAIQKRADQLATKAMQARETAIARLLQEIRADVNRGNWKQGCPSWTVSAPLRRPGNHCCFGPSASP